MNSAYRLISVGCFALALLGCATRETSAGLHGCLESQYGKTLVRTDGDNHRIFLTWTSATTPDRDGLVALLRRAESCMEADPQWAEQYSISVFSAAKYAGYMTEERILPLVKSGEWEQAYLAEFDRATGILTFSPVVSPTEFTVP